MSKQRDPQNDWTFSGFAFPNYTPIPDQLFDELLAILTGAELKVLLYICRRTFGFKRESDNISLNQMLDGITKQNGGKLDQGTGLSKPTLLRALKSLQEKNILVAERQSDEQRGNLATNYQLNMGGEGELKNDTPPRSKNEPTLGKKMSLGEEHFFTKPLVKKCYPQETVVQQTDLQETETTTTAPQGSENQNHAIADALSQTAVVVALSIQGIGKQVAEKLAAQHSVEHIQEKITYLEFLLEDQPDAIKRPAAWLRKAIEDNYAAPDGFISAEERERQAQVAAQEAFTMEEQDRLYEDRRRQQEAADERERQAFLSQLQEQYDTSQADQEIWQKFLEQTEMSLSAANFSLFQSALLLRIEEAQALVAVNGAEHLQRLMHPNLTTVFKRTMKHILGREVTPEYEVVEGLRI